MQSPFQDDQKTEDILKMRHSKDAVMLKFVAGSAHGKRHPAARAQQPPRNFLVVPGLLHRPHVRAVPPDARRAWQQRRQPQLRPRRAAVEGRRSGPGRRRVVAARPAAVAQRRRRLQPGRARLRLGNGQLGEARAHSVQRLVRFRHAGIGLHGSRVRSTGGRTLEFTKIHG